jgi:hypothetical protein
VLEPNTQHGVKCWDSKKLTEISSDLTIPGFDVTVHNPHSCQVKSQDGQHEFSVEIDESHWYPLKFWGRRFHLGAWQSGGITYTTDADDAITQVATLLKLMDQLSSEGFSVEITQKYTTAGQLTIHTIQMQLLII